MSVDSSQDGFARILVAFDGSEDALRACRVGAGLAKRFGSEVTVLYVIPTLSVFTAPLVDEYYAVQVRRAKELLEGAASVFREEGASAATDVIQGRASIVETIVEYASDKKSDLIVMGTRGLGGFRKLLVGSVSSGVLAHAHCAVLVVR